MAAEDGDKVLVILHCVRCENEIQQSMFLRGRPWVHRDETIDLNGHNNYDHAADPGFVDVHSREVKRLDP